MLSFVVLLSFVSSVLGQLRPTVTAPIGPVIGVTTLVTLATAPASRVTVSKYIGIPFASNPPLRFAPPQPAATWTKPLDASTTKPACIQQFLPLPDLRRVFNNPFGPPPAESEDCLYLNVWVPPGAKPTDALPVMFWIYGGNLQFGTGSVSMYDGASFAANQKVIVVTHNYRTNIFGFSMSPELPPKERNVGFLDQRLALQWVHNNIAAFGGDPNKITIFGESAGGYSVEQLIAYPPSPSSFRGAILQSKGFFGAPDAGIDGSSGWNEALIALGCLISLDQLGCMRSKSATSIQNAISTILFSPVVDGATYTTDIRSRMGAGAAKIPVLLGTNGQEGNIFAYVLGLEDPGASLFNSLEDFFGNTLLATAIDETLTDVSNAPYSAVSKVITDFAFTCTTGRLASTFHDFGYKVWRYYYNASFPDEATFPNSEAYHSSEIPQVFGTYPISDQYGDATAQQAALSVYMQTAWANFAKDPSSGPQLNWPELGAAGNVQDLGGNGAYGGYTISATSIDNVCVVYDPIISAFGY